MASSTLWELKYVTMDSRIRAKNLLKSRMTPEQKRAFSELFETSFPVDTPLGHRWVVTNSGVFGLSIRCGCDKHPYQSQALSVCLTIQSNNRTPIYDDMLSLKEILEAKGGEDYAIKNANFCLSVSHDMACVDCFENAVSLVRFFVGRGAKFT